MSNGDQTPPGGQGFQPFPESDAELIEKLKLIARKAGGGWSGFWAALWGGFVIGFIELVTLVVRLIDFIFAKVAVAFAAAQGEENPEFWELVAAVTTDITGVEVDAEELKKTRQGAGRINVMEKVGQQVFDLLAQEFLTPPGRVQAGKQTFQPGDGVGGLPAFTISPEQGVEAARRFMGYGMSFAVREANVGVLGEVASLGFLKNFRDYGENMVANLAIGRLMRIALRPLMQVAIADPLTQAMNKQYHPKLLNESQVVTLFHHGLIDQATLFEELERQGYDAQRIRALVEVLKTHISPDDLELLWRYGVLSRGDAASKLTAQGFSADDAEMHLKVIDLRRLDSIVRAQADLAQKQFEDGVLDADELRAALEALPLTDDEKQLRRVLAASHVELPRRFPTLAQMGTALTEGVITVGEYDEFLLREGYSSDDATILRLLALLKTAKALEARQAAEARAAAKEAAAKAKAAKAKPTP